MTDEQIKQAVREGAHLLVADNVTRQGVRAVVSLLAKHQRELEAARRQGSVAPTAPTLADVMATRRLDAFLRDRVMDCRQQIFGSSAPPFKTQMEAAAWASSESHRHSLASPEAAAITSQLQSIDAGPGSPVRVAYEARYVLLADPKEAQPPDPLTDAFLAAQMGHTWFLQAGRSMPLGYLSDVQRRLSEQAGVHEWEITRFILRDIPPAVRRWRPRVPELGLLLGDDPPPWFSIEIRDRHLSFQEVRELFGVLVDDGFLVPTTASAEQRAKLEHVLEFVEERREFCTPPMSWVDVLTEWNEETPEAQYSLRGIKKAHSDALRLFGRSKPEMRRAPRRGSGHRYEKRPRRPPTQDAGDRPRAAARSPGRHPLDAMNLLAERALAGDREAQAQLIPDYERAAGPEVAGALKARFAFDADIDTLVARALAGDAGAADEAVKRVLVVRGPLEADDVGNGVGGGPRILTTR